MNCACTKKFYEIFIPALAGLYTGQSIFYLSAKKSALKRAPLKEMKKMSTSAIADVRGRVHETSKADPLSSLKRQWSAVFVSTATLGIAAGVVGLGINALFLFGLAENKGALSLAGTWLLVVAFPLLFLSAHALDRVDKVERAMRTEFCREHGLEDHEC